MVSLIRYPVLKQYPIFEILPSDIVTHIISFIKKRDIHKKLFCLSKACSTAFCPKYVHLLVNHTYMMFKTWYDGFIPSFDLRNLKTIIVGIRSYYPDHSLPPLGYIPVRSFTVDNILVQHSHYPAFGWTPPSVTTFCISGMPMSLALAHKWHDTGRKIEFPYKETFLQLNISQYVVYLLLDKCLFRNIDFSGALALKRLWLDVNFCGSIRHFPPNLRELIIMNYKPYLYDEEDNELCVSYTKMFAPMGTTTLYIGPMAPVMVTSWTPTLQKVYLPNVPRIVKYELPDGDIFEEEMIDAPFPDGFGAEIIRYEPV